VDNNALFKYCISLKESDFKINKSNKTTELINTTLKSRDLTRIIDKCRNSNLV